MAIKYKGEKCNLCGYDTCVQALEFHHMEGKEKDFGVSEREYTRSWTKVKAELDMVCANCHRELHIGLRSFPK